MLTDGHNGGEYVRRDDRGQLFPHACGNKNRQSLLVIAHRLKTIKDAGQILVVSDGRIIERGDHEQLCTLNGTYAHMVSLQAS